MNLAIFLIPDRDKTGALQHEAERKAQCQFAKSSKCLIDRQIINIGSKRAHTIALNSVTP